MNAKVHSPDQCKINNTETNGLNNDKSSDFQAGNDIVLKALVTPNILTSGDLTHLQQGAGNRATGRILNRHLDLPENWAQRQPIGNSALHVVSSPDNRTGLPDDLKAGLECLSGFDLAKVRVHFNSSRPNQIGALAYTQGMEIHLGPGQERHLPHEAWHVVQQMQGRVSPTLRLNGIGLNNQPELEQEADLQSRRLSNFSNGQRPLQQVALPDLPQPVQRKVGFEFETTAILPQKLNPEGEYVPLDKDEIVKSFDGYDVTADIMDENTRASDLEIKTKEIDENNETEVIKLINQTVPAVENTIDNITGASFSPIPDFSVLDFWKPAQEIQGFANCADYFFHSFVMSKYGVTGKLQMTSGIHVRSLANFMTERAKNVYQSSISVDYGFLNTLLRGYQSNLYKFWEIARSCVTKFLPQITIQGQIELMASIVTLLSELPIRARIAQKPGNEKLPYPKAGTSMMARTDFATILGLLPPEVKSVLSGNLTTLVVDTVNQVLQSYNISTTITTEDDPVFPRGAFLSDGPDLTALTIGNWIETMLPNHMQPRDLLTGEHFPGGTDATDWLWPLGGYGIKLDPGDKPIFEFRSIDVIKASDLTKTIRILIQYMQVGAMD